MVKCSKRDSHKSCHTCVLRCALNHTRNLYLSISIMKSIVNGMERWSEKENSSNDAKRTNTHRRNWGESRFFSFSIPSQFLLIRINVSEPQITKIIKMCVCVCSCACVLDALFDWKSTPKTKTTYDFGTRVFGVLKVIYYRPICTKCARIRSIVFSNFDSIVSKPNWTEPNQTIRRFML